MNSKEISNFLLRPGKFSDVKGKLQDKDITRVFDDANTLSDLSSLMTTNNSTRGISWNIPKLDEYTRTISYLINAGIWQAEKVLGRGFDLNIEDTDISTTKKVQNQINEKYYNSLFSMFYMGYFHGGSGALIVIDGKMNKRELKKPLKN